MPGIFRAIGKAQDYTQKMEGLYRMYRLILDLKLQSKINGSPLELTVERTYHIGKNVKFTLRPGDRNKIHIGKDTVIGDDVEFDMRGSELYIGPRCIIKKGCVIKLDGNLTLEGECGMSCRCFIHCGKSITLKRFCTLGEYTSLLDGAHIHPQTTDEWFYTKGENVYGPITVGVNAYVGNKTTILMDVEIGDCAIIGANSVVNKSIPAHYLAAGVPAKPIKCLLEKKHEENKAKGAKGVARDGTRKKARAAGGGGK